MTRKNAGGSHNGDTARNAAVIATATAAMAGLNRRGRRQEVLIIADDLHQRGIGVRTLTGKLSDERDDRR